MAQAMKFNLIAFATAWGARHGGVNSFNMDLLQSLASAYRHAIAVTCVVPVASDDEAKSARDGEVNLINLGLPESGCFGLNQSLDGMSEVTDISDDGGLIWLGHDRITGELAIRASKKHGGKSIVIHHMSYSHYESFAENGPIAHRKYLEQKEIFAAADIVVAVGPLLRDALADMLDVAVDNIPMLVPGLPEIEPKLHVSKIKAFMSGRLDEGAAKIKQANLAVAAFAHSVKRCDMDAGLPTSLRGESEPSMVLRGMNWEGDSSGEQTGAERDLLRFAEDCASRALNIRALPFTEDRNQLFDDVRSSSICLMPSWHEGFGLVAWESIAAGVPSIISKKSGVHQLLSAYKAGSLLSWYENIDVRGCADAPYFRDEDKITLSDKIIGIAKDLESWKEKARHLREALLLQFSWASCAESLVDAVGWKVFPVSAHGLLSVGQPSVDPVIGLKRNALFYLNPCDEFSKWVDIPSPTEDGGVGAGPSHLLRAEEALMPFDDSARPFFDALIAWVRRDSGSVEAKLIVGQGGAGKTRTAIEVCKSLRDYGYVSGFILGEMSLRGADELAREIRGHGGDKFCLVIDYAETRADVFLKLLSGIISDGVPRCVKILLLARAGGEWWEQLSTRSSHCAAFLESRACTGPFEIPILYGSDKGRVDAYRDALGIFSKVLNIPRPAHIPSLVSEHYGHPLFVHMAALMSVLGERATTAENLSRSLLNHERRYWRMAVLHDPHGQSEDDYVRLMVLASLCDGVVSEKSIEREWVAAGGQKSVLSRVFRALAPLYPGRQGLQGLKPDILGEALVAQTALVADDQRLISAVLASSQMSIRHSALTCLARTLRHRPDLASLVEKSLLSTFHVCCKELVRACVETGGALPDIAARAFSLLPLASRIRIARLLEPDFAQENTPLSGLDVAIEEANYEIAAKRAGKGGDKSSGKLGVAKALHNLSEAYSRDGQSAKSFGCSMRSEEIFGALCASAPTVHSAGWARALGSHGNNLCRQGLPDQALVFFERAQAIYRDLISSGDASRRSDLANVMGGASIALVDLGDNDGAIDYTQGALDIYSSLAEASPEEFNPSLALALNNYANRLSEVGRVSDAMVASKRSLEIQAALAIDHPERYEANLATALSNHATVLSASGCIERALEVSLQSKLILERLSAMRPDRFDQVYASSLGNLANYFFEVGNFQSSLDNSLRSVEKLERLYVQDKIRYSASLESALVNHAGLLELCGHGESALIFCERAIHIGNMLILRNPEKYSPLLVNSSSMRGRLLVELGDADCALKCLEGALSVGVSQSQAKLQNVAVQMCNAAMCQAIVSWLVSDLDGVVPDMELESVAEPALSAINYSRSMLLAIFSSSGDHLRAAIMEGDAAWSRMHSGQHCYHLDEFILMSALAESRLGDVVRRSRMVAARERLMVQRGGGLPRLTLLIAGRLGISDVLAGEA